MNITEYRAMKAQEAEAPESTPIEQPPAIEPNPPEQVEDTPQVEPSLPSHIEIEGVGAVPVDELAKGYLRQSDYTRKTQELAQERARTQYAQQLFEAIQSNPELAESLGEYGVELPDPREAAFKELNDRYQDLLLEREVEELKGRYEDFDTREVLQFAYDNKYENLEDAYLLLRSRNATPQHDVVDVDALKEQIRQELLRDLQSGVDTHTIIQSGGDTSPVRDTTPQLSAQEVKVARNLRMSPEEYAKWRDKR